VGKWPFSEKEAIGLPFAGDFGVQNWQQGSKWPDCRKASADLPQGEASPTARRAACERQAVNAGRYPFHTFSTF